MGCPRAASLLEPSACLRVRPHVFVGREAEAQPAHPADARNLAAAWPSSSAERRRAAGGGPSSAPSPACAAPAAAVCAGCCTLAARTPASQASCGTRTTSRTILMAPRLWRSAAHTSPSTSTHARMSLKVPNCWSSLEVGSITKRRGPRLRAHTGAVHSAFSQNGNGPSHARPPSSSGVLLLFLCFCKTPL